MFCKLPGLQGLRCRTTVSLQSWKILRLPWHEQSQRLSRALKLVAAPPHARPHEAHQTPPVLEGLSAPQRGNPPISY